MILQVAMPFRARVVPSGRRDEAERVGLASVFVEVREVSGADAPAALRHREGGRDRTVRSMAGALWAEAGGSGAIGADALRDLAAARPAAGDPLGRSALDGPPLTDAEAARQRFSNEEVLRARLHEAAAGLVLVDGVLHAPVQEPVYAVDLSRGWASVRVVPAGKAPDPLAAFSAVEREILESTHGVEIAPCDRIEVLDPAAIGAEVVGRAVLRAAEQARARLASLIAERDWETFSAYKGLRDALAGLGGSGDGLGGVPEALRACLGEGVGLDARTDAVVSLALARLERSDLADLPILAAP